jgi:hypothetical protein
LGSELIEIKNQGESNEKLQIQRRSESGESFHSHRNFGCHRYYLSPRGDLVSRFRTGAGKRAARELCE